MLQSTASQRVDTTEQLNRAELVPQSVSGRVVSSNLDALNIMILANGCILRSFNSSPVL